MRQTYPVRTVETKLGVPNNGYFLLLVKNDLECVTLGFQHIFSRVVKSQLVDDLVVLYNLHAQVTTISDSYSCCLKYREKKSFNKTCS